MKLFFPLFLFPFQRKRDTFKEINGFYGLMGPDVNKNQINNLYDLFMANGIVQGVFFNKGNITFVKNYINTSKLNSAIPYLNTFDISNTNIIKIDDSYYSLFEHNNPYELDISFQEKRVHTRHKISVPGVRLFSGHTKYDSKSNIITTVDYNIVTKDVHLYTLEKEKDEKKDSILIMLKKTKIPFVHRPLVHDFYVLDDKTILMDSPFFFEWRKRMIQVDKTKSTFVHIIDSNKREMYELKESVYLFHYAFVKETRETMEIYAPFYDSIDFSKIDSVGTYRRIVIEKKTKQVRMEREEELEKYSVEFPILYEDKVILRIMDMEGRKNNGFLVCKDLKIVDKIMLGDELSICGEPSLIYVHNKDPYLLFLCYNEQYNYVGLLNLKTKIVEKKRLSMPLSMNLTIGFHSLFVHE
jgi:carotenoid cleavage dioxygenase-like enzyme